MGRGRGRVRGRGRGRGGGQNEKVSKYGFARPHCSQSTSTRRTALGDDGARSCGVSDQRPWTNEKAGGVMFLGF